MRRLLLGAGLTAAMLAAPAWGATTDVQVKGYSFSPANVTVAPGDTVTWHFAGPDLNHSVTADDGSFDSDPSTSSPLHAPGDTFAHTFPTAGTFSYHCKVHSFMTGKVVVSAPGTGPPPDTRDARITGLAVKGGRSCKGAGRKCHKKATSVSFKSDEAGSVKLSFKRSKGHSPKPLTKAMRFGANKLSLSPKRVPQGRYTLTLEATDGSGNSSPLKTAKFRVR
jgi:plastocyanin